MNNELICTPVAKFTLEQISNWLKKKHFDHWGETALKDLSEPSILEANPPTPSILPIEDKVDVKLLIDSIKNLLGAVDTPVRRRKYPDQFLEDAIAIAREAIEQTPIYSVKDKTFSREEVKKANSDYQDFIENIEPEDIPTFSEWFDKHY